MATEYLTTTMGICNHFHDFGLCQDEIPTILQTLGGNYDNSNIFNMAAASHPDRLLENKNSCIISKKKRKSKPVKAASFSSSMGLGFDEDSDEGHAMLRKRKSVKRLKVSPPASSTEDGSGEYGKGISHIAVERNRRKQMNEHLAMLRQLMPSFYVKKVCLLQTSSTCLCACFLSYILPYNNFGTYYLMYVLTCYVK